jgi:hypothetical protein
VLVWKSAGVLWEWLFGAAGAWGANGSREREPASKQWKSSSADTLQRACVMYCRHLSHSSEASCNNVRGLPTLRSPCMVADDPLGPTPQQSRRAVSTWLGAAPLTCWGCATCAEPVHEADTLQHTTGLTCGQVCLRQLHQHLQGGGGAAEKCCRGVGDSRTRLGWLVAKDACVSCIRACTRSGRRWMRDCGSGRWRLQSCGQQGRVQGFP